MISFKDAGVSGQGSAGWGGGLAIDGASEDVMVMVRTPVASRVLVLCFFSGQDWPTRGGHWTTEELEVKIAEQFGKYLAVVSLGGGTFDRVLKGNELNKRDPTSDPLGQRLPNLGPRGSEVD